MLLKILLIEDLKILKNGQSLIESTLFLTVNTKFFIINHFKNVRFVFGKSRFQVKLLYVQYTFNFGF